MKWKIQNYFDKTVFKTILYDEKIRIRRVLLWIKNPDPGDPKRPDPTVSGSGTTHSTHDISKRLMNKLLFETHAVHIELYCKYGLGAETTKLNKK